MSWQSSSKVSARMVSVLASLVVVASSGCSTESAAAIDDPGSEYLGQLLVPTSSERADEMMRLVLRTEQGVVAECMQSAGFEYTPAPPEALFVVGSYANTDDTDFVDEFGFGLSTRSPSAGSQIADNPNDATYLALDDVKRTQWGETYAGCESEGQAIAAEQLGLTKAAATAERVRAQVAADPAVVSALAGWVSCVGAEGLSASSPSDLEDQFSNRWFDLAPEEQGAFRAEELRVARVSFDCRTDLRAAETAATKSAIETLDPDAFDTIYN